MDYFAARGLGSTKNKIKRRALLCVSLLSNLGLLFTFKYFNFVSDSLREVLKVFSIQFSAPLLDVLLPVGISFYTFQTLGYTLDVYNKKIKPERHFGIFAVYVSFFPQLVAGPIERAGKLIPQFFVEHKIKYKRVTDGLKVMLWGFFLKVVIADRLAIVVNQVYNNVDAYTGLPLLIATVFFSFQIYCDFAGYSFIAIGAAKVIGISLMDNFRRPYHADTIANFWRRWHISLTTWFRDYIYIPLGGNRVSMPRWYFNILVVFIVSGVWHGANWTFIIWGFLHGMYLVFGKITTNPRMFMKKRLGFLRMPIVDRTVKIAITFSLVTISWIFFRANSLSDALYVISHLFSNWSWDISSANLGGIGITGLIIAITSIVFMEIVHAIQSQKGIREFLSTKPRTLRWSIYIILLLAIFLFGSFGETEFIYFQF